VESTSTRWKHEIEKELPAGGMEAICAYIDIRPGFRCRKKYATVYSASARKRLVNAYERANIRPTRHTCEARILADNIPAWRQHLLIYGNHQRSMLRRIALPLNILLRRGASCADSATALLCHPLACPFRQPVLLPCCPSVCVSVSP
jgi:hypothetical protein